MVERAEESEGLEENERVEKRVSVTRQTLTKLNNKKVQKNEVCEM
jgi:hypothetical protein